MYLFCYRHAVQVHDQEVQHLIHWIQCQIKIIIGIPALKYQVLFQSLKIIKMEFEVNKILGERQVHH